MKNKRFKKIKLTKYKIQNYRDIKKIKNIKKHKLYFNNEKPEISDAEFDKLKEEVKDLEKRFS